ncbi:hypothetical protein PPACK8108_LOCUS11151 [Phakopsora pachyrhizi]|uniref:Uncharacterized protein n=1 Tax=Phakopsora pachyrhizi TaxID=170000 RepID=A0AAV0AZI5_PHAPC|nr:hypothetical protein PPACK8108_LOCUS11151 [Phakopsora pachyrhizi]
MSKMDGKPDDVHDKEYHTMIKGLLSDKEFRKTLPAGLRINSEIISRHWVYCDLGYQSDMAPYPYNLQMIDSSPLKSL